MLFIKTKTTKNGKYKMRARKKKNRDSRLAAASHLLTTPETSLAATPDAFARFERAELEIGCGKGNFSIGMSDAKPNAAFFALEKITDVMITALEKASVHFEEKGIDLDERNLFFILGDAGDVTEYFAPHSLDTIYLNFSDPWPKKGYAKRRLTHENFLKIYAPLLKDDGVLRFKTDNVGLFDFSLEELERSGWSVSDVTRDLHANGNPEGNVMTEYETNFVLSGKPICSLVAKPGIVKIEE